MIADPLCLFEGDMRSGAPASIVLTRKELAEDLPQQPAYGQDATTANLGRALWALIDLTPKDATAHVARRILARHLVMRRAQLLWSRRSVQVDTERSDPLGRELPTNTFGRQVSDGRLHGFGH